MSPRTEQEWAATVALWGDPQEFYALWGLSACPEQYLRWLAVAWGVFG